MKWKTHQENLSIEPCKNLLLWEISIVISLTCGNIEKSTEFVQNIVQELSIL